MTNWRAGTEFTGNLPIAIPVPQIGQLPFDLSFVVNPHGAEYGGYGPFGNLFGTYFMRVVTVTVDSTLGTGWFSGTGTSQSRIYIYDADGSAIAFKASDNSPIGSGTWSSLVIDGGSSDAYYILKNAGPPGSIRSKGFWVYNFDMSKRLTKIIDPAGNEQSIDQTSAPNLVVTTTTSTSQKLEFVWDGSTVEIILDEYKNSSWGQTTLGSIGYYSTPKRAHSVAWDGLPEFDLSYSYGVYPSAAEDQLALNLFQFDTFDGMGGLKRLFLAGHGGLSDFVITPSTPDTEIVRVDGQFDSHDETLSSTTYTLDGSVLDIANLSPRLNGSTDDGSEDSVIVVNADGTVASATYKWDNTSGHDSIYFYSYNGYGLLSQVEDSYSNTVTYGFTTVHVLRDIAGDEDVSVSVSLPNSITDQTGKTTSWTYDNNDENEIPNTSITSVTIPGSFTTDYGYNEVGQLEAVSFPGHENPWQYSHYPTNVVPAGSEGFGGYLSEIKDPTYRVISFNSYDRHGNVLESSIYPDWLNPALTDYLRDDAGRITNLRPSDYDGDSHNETVYTYDGATGALITVNDPEGRQFNILYQDDSSGLVDKTTLGTGSPQTFFDYTYNDFGWVTRIADGNDTGVSYEYGDQDAPETYNAGELAKVHYDKPGGTDTEEFKYYRNGLIHHWINTRGDDIEYVYNKNGWLLHIYVTPNGGSVYDYAEYTYDAAGRMLTAERKNAGGSLVLYTYAYNSTSKRLDSVTARFWKVTSGYFDKVMNFTYNPDGTRESREDGFTTTTMWYGYDDAGRLTTLDEEYDEEIESPFATGPLATWDYDGAGRPMTQELRAGKIVTNYSYHDWFGDLGSDFGHGFLADATTQWVPGGYTDPSDLTEFTYTAFKDNRVATYTDTKSGSAWTSGSYTYDAYSQIDYEVRDSVTTNYAFDSSYNLTTKGSKTLAYDTNQLTTVNTDERTFSYNDLGARDQEVVAGGNTYDYSYDPFGNLTQVQIHGGAVVYSCEYDPFGRRFRWSSGTPDNGNTTFLLHDGAPYAEFNNTGTLQRRYIWGVTGLCCIRAASNRWSISDKFGNTRALVDDDGSITDYYAYDAWGGLVGGKSSASSFNPFRWNGASGYLYVPETGLYHVGAREYDPTAGRWLQRDPIAMSGGYPNLYSYCANDPVEAVDSDGLEKLIVAANGEQSLTGTHLVIGLVDESGKARWYGFYPKAPESGGKNKKGRGGGPGYVKDNDYPDSRTARGQEWEISNSDYQKLKATIEDSKADYDKGRGKAYDLETYNCSAWVEDMVSAALPNRVSPSTKRVRSPKQVLNHLRSESTFPGGSRSWTPGGSQ